MERFKTDAKTGLQYELRGDYYVIAEEYEPQQPPIGIWGQRHLRWLKQNRRITYTNLLTSGRLYDYQHSMDSQTYERFELLIRRMVEVEGITEGLKAEHQLDWVGRMNNIRARAEEVIRSELICR